MREVVVERHLGKRVKELGGMSLKLLPVSHAGLPDRLVLLPDGSAHLIELKAPGGHVRPVQRVMHERLGLINHPVTVLSSVAEVDAWADEHPMHLSNRARIRSVSIND